MNSFFNGTRIHMNDAAREVLTSRAVEWTHVVRRNPVPPSYGGSYKFGGSYNHLVWDLLQRRGHKDLIIEDYFPEALEIAAESEVPIIQIENRIGDFAKAFRIFRARFRPSATAKSAQSRFYETATTLLKQTDCRQLLVWNTLGSLPMLRTALPEHTIAFAQRHFDYDSARANDYGYADLMIAQTRGQLRWVFNHTPQLTPFSVVIPNGVETEVFRPATTEECTGIRRELGIPVSRFVAIFPSKLAPYKGTYYLTQWIERCRKESADIHFLVAGKMNSAVHPSHARELRTVLSESPNVTWLEGVSRDQMPELYRAADVSLMPGVWREGFSMSAIESMSSALPVIASDGGCYNEIVLNDFNGVVCPQEHLYEGFQRELLRLSSNPALTRRMGENARKYVEARLTREKVLTNFEKFLERDYAAIDDDISVSAFAAAANQSWSVARIARG